MENMYIHIYSKVIALLYVHIHVHVSHFIMIFLRIKYMYVRKAFYNIEARKFFFARTKEKYLPI